MYAALLRQLVWLAGNCGVGLALLFAVPQESSETVSAHESVAIVRRDTPQTLELACESVQQDQYLHGLHVPDPKTGLTSHFGYEGRRLSATLLAPLRC